MAKTAAAGDVNHRKKRSGDRALYCPREFNENDNSRSQMQREISSWDPPTARETLTEMQE